MTVTEFLKKTGVDITTNKSPLGNHLKADLSTINYQIDFNKDLRELTEEDLYQIGRSLILSENKGEAFFGNQIIDFMKNLISEETSLDKTTNESNKVL